MSSGTTMNKQDEYRKEFEEEFNYNNHEYIWDAVVKRYVRDSHQCLWVGYLAGRLKSDEEIERLEYEYKSEINRQVLMMNKITKLRTLLAQAKPWVGSDSIREYDKQIEWLKSVNEIIGE